MCGGPGGGPGNDPHCPPAPTSLLLTKWCRQALKILIQFSKAHRFQLLNLTSTDCTKVWFINFQSGGFTTVERKSGKTLLCGIGLPTVQSGFNSSRGPFNNYVDKMRSKMSVFVHAQGIKTVHAGGGVKNGKILST